MTEDSGEHETETPANAVEIIEPQPRKRKPGGGRKPDEGVRRTREARQRLDLLAVEHAEEVFKLLMEGARNGDPTCLRTICSRLWPERRGMPIVFSMPPVKTPEDLAAAHEHFLEQASQGVLTLEEANMITNMIDRKGKALETVELAKQLAELKEQIAQITGGGEAVV